MHAIHPAELMTMLPVMTSTYVTLIVTLVTPMPIVSVIKEEWITHVMLVSTLIPMMPI